MFKKTVLLTALTLYTALMSSPAMAARQTLTLSFGQRTVEIEAPLGMCFIDGNDKKQAALLDQMRRESWKGRKYVVMTLFGDCNEIAGLQGSKDPVPLKSAGILRWLNPDIGETTAQPLEEYLDMREVSYRAYVQKDMTQFRDATLASAPTRLKNAVALDYVGTTLVDGQPFKTIGVDATTLLGDIPVDVTFVETFSTIDRKDVNTAPLMKLAAKFIDQQVNLNKRAP